MQMEGFPYEAYYRSALESGSKNCPGRKSTKTSGRLISNVCELSRCLDHRNMAGYFYFKEPEVHQNQEMVLNSKTDKF